MEWIKTTDNLPETDGADFFVYYENEKEFGIARFSVIKFDDSNWHDSGFSVYPTHWCVPTTPKD